MAKNDDKKKEEPKAEATPEELAAKAAKRKKLIFIGGGVLTAALIGGGAFFFLAGGDNKMAAKPGSEQEIVAEKGAAPATETDAEKKEPAAKPAAGATPAEATTATPASGSAAPAPTTPGIDFGCTQALKPFHLNLGNPLENRYIRMEISVEYGCADTIKAEIEKRLPQLRDAVISVVGQKTREALLSPDGKAQLTKEIHHRLNHYMTNKIDNVFITDILIE